MDNVPEKLGPNIVGNFIVPNPGGIEAIKGERALPVIEVVPAPGDGGDEAEILQITLRTITNKMLSLMHPDQTEEHIANMSLEELKTAIEEVNRKYAFRGVLLTTNTKNIYFHSPPHPYSGNSEPETHSIKSITHIVETGSDSEASPEGIFVSGYNTLEGGKFEANKYVSREVEDPLLEIMKILKGDPKLTQDDMKDVFPAILVYERDALEPTNRNYLMKFKSGTNARKALVAVFIAPRLAEIR